MEKKKWIQDVVKHKGALRKEAKREHLIKGDEKLSMTDLNKLEKKGGKTAKRAVLAKTLRKFYGGGEPDEDYQILIFGEERPEPEEESEEPNYYDDDYASGGKIKEKVFIEYLNKSKGYKMDRKYFNSYQEAERWARNNFDKFNTDYIRYEYAVGGEIEWGEDLGDGFSVGNDVYITDSKSMYQGKTGFVSGLIGKDLLVTISENGNERSFFVSKKGVEKLDAPEFAKGGKVKKDFKAGDKVIYAPNGKWFVRNNLRNFKKGEITNVEVISGTKDYTIEFKNKYGEIIDTLQTYNTKELELDPDVEMAKGGKLPNGKTINGYDVHYFKTGRWVYANIEIPSPNPTFVDDTQIKGFGKDEKEAFNDLKKEFEKYLKSKDNKMAKGGYMAKGGETKPIVIKVGDFFYDTKKELNVEVTTLYPNNEVILQSIDYNKNAAKNTFSMPLHILKSKVKGGNYFKIPRSNMAKGGMTNKNPSKKELDEFFEYVKSFYGHNGVRENDFPPKGASDEKIKGSINVYMTRVKYDGVKWGGGDSIDRERVKEIMITNYSDKMAYGGMTAGRWYTDNKGKEFRYIGESEGKLLFKDGENVISKSEEDFEDMPKEKKLFKFFRLGGALKDNFLIEMSDLHNNIQEIILKDGSKVTKSEFMEAQQFLEPNESQEYYASMQYAKGGMSSTFSDKVNAIAKKLEGKPVPAPYRKEYGTRYDKEDAKEAASRIVGNMRKMYGE